MSSQFPLWSDEPATQDLLAFQAVAETVVDSLFDDGLDPVAIGLSGAWGSGKTSVLELVKDEIDKRSKTVNNTVLVIPTQPWSYDPTVGPKESLISDVLGSLSKEFENEDPAGKEGLEAFRKLIKKINWSKAVKMLGRTAITTQLPKLDDIFDLVSDDPESLDNDKGMAAFREEFEELLSQPGLKHLSRVVVLVDDLDRCLPDTVVDTLEAIRLFLSAKGMSFIIAADEDRVADAIRQKLKTQPLEQEGEDPAKLYLHKIVQTTVPLPALSRFDTEAYLFLLLAKSALHVDADTYAALVSQCDDLRVNGGRLESIKIDDDDVLNGHLVTAARLTPILYEKFHGNPRRIKRFLNDLNVRQAVANRRGINLPTDAVAKLMVLERILTNDFGLILEWLAKNQLRDKLNALEHAANGSLEVTSEALADDNDELSTEADQEPAASLQEKTSTSIHEDTFSDTLLRWAKLPPMLDASMISGYLYLAAAFAHVDVIDTGLPERLRDIADALSSNLQLDRTSVSAEQLRSLPEPDAQLLVTYLGRRTRDQPSIQKSTVEGLFRLASEQPTTQSTVVAALKGIPAKEIETATVVRLLGLNSGIYRSVLETWKNGTDEQHVLRAIKLVEEKWSTNHGH